MTSDSENRIIVHPMIAKEIRLVSKNLGIPPTKASIIVFYGLDKKNLWSKSFMEARIGGRRKTLKANIAMTL